MILGTSNWTPYLKGRSKLPVKEVPITPGGNYDSFVAACRAGVPSMVNGTIRDAHCSCTLGHLMNISFRLGKEVPFNTGIPNLLWTGVTFAQTGLFGVTSNVIFKKSFMRNRHINL